MKYLAEYTAKPIEDAMNTAGAFFAFGQEQCDAKADQSKQYAQLGMGLMCPVDTAAQLTVDLAKIHAQGVKDDIADNGLNAIIRRELSNYECYYTGDAEDAISALELYPVTREDILKVFKNKHYEPSTEKH